MKKVMVFFGTRPEAIKLAPVIDVLRSDGRFETKVCSTGQHKEMLDQVVDFFNIKVDHSLQVMEPNQHLSALTSKLLVKISSLLAHERPDMIMVQGDTTTTFAASLAAFYDRIPVLHVEAGLRTYNRHSPFPEEMNRVVTSRVTDVHYAPTEISGRNLKEEGVPADKIIITGNTVIDALFLGLKKLGDTVPAGIVQQGVQDVKNFILVTMHRRENHGDGIRNICSAIRRIVDETSVPVIFPVHLNPNVKDAVHELLGGHPLIHLIPPCAYPEFLWLLNRSFLILTDSGGVQEEAPSLGKPVLLLRDTTERPEAMDAGTVLKVGSDPELIYTEAITLLTNVEAYEAMAMKVNPYGDGHASEKILASMLTLG
jgi:UDP-N-acetylglucosamine 2-epimerase (non-hydrolysing)